jgi:hypothetical protein
MTKNPIYNALAAFGYIVVVVTAITLLSKVEANAELGQFLMPIIMLSLLTLSVATMGYIFFLQPIKLYLEKKKEDAIQLFLKTLGYFAGIVIVVLILTYLFVTK